MGVVSTNARMISGNGSGNANGADLPTHLSSLSVNSGNKFVTLSLGYINTSFVSGIQVNYKTGSYPTSPSNGNSIAVTGAATSINITGLTNAVTYYFRVFLYNEVNGVKYYQTDITNARITGVPRVVEVSGITPFAVGADHLVITQSGSFNLTAPKGTKIILGGGARNSDGGTVSNPITLNFDCNNAPCTATVANYSWNRNQYPQTTLKIFNQTTNAYETFSSGNTKNDVRVVQSKWGPIGGNGGRGIYSGTEYDWTAATNPTGAGGGGAGYYSSKNPPQDRGTAGGNWLGYGNHGGNGGYYPNCNDKNEYYGKAGSPGLEQRDVPMDTAYGNGGCGGFSAGAGSGYYYDYSGDYEDETDEEGANGYPGSGIIVFEWDA